ncbi:hypothetical protein F5Y08DRAFT_292635 [Xylaria arbuscula]|nr:hypothetical protein F5Y08DRAFT_292635 [Xylaria arbuscula]
MPALLLRSHLKVIRSIPSRPSNLCRKSPQRQHSSTTTTSPATPSSSNPKTTTSTNTVGSEPIAQKAEIHSAATARITQPGEAAKPEVPIPVPSIVPPPPFWQRLGPLTRATQAYGRAQRARPWLTQVASTLVVYLCADFGAQWIGQSSSADGDDAAKAEGRKHDWARTARSLIIGGAAAIPGYTWFSFLSRSFNYSSKVLSIGIKVAVNQFFFTPLFNVYFFGAQALLSGDTPAEAWRRVCNTVPVSFINSCKLWPAVTAFNFAFVPFEYRSIFGGVIAVGWQTYLSFLNRRAERLEALRQTEAEESPAAVVVARSMRVEELPAGKQAIMG